MNDAANEDNQSQSNGDGTTTRSGRTMLVELDPEIYKNFVTFEGKTPILYLHVIKALYGMLQSALLFYKKLIKDLASIGFKTTPMTHVWPTVRLMANSTPSPGMSTI
jgi:hypothetical protein